MSASMEMSALPDTWAVQPFGEINQFSSSTVDPSTRPDQSFQLYSVPSFPSGRPERAKGSAIGSTKQTVTSGDVLISKINPRINRVWTVGAKTTDQQIASSEWIGFRSDAVQPGFANYYFKSPGFRDLLCSEVAGVGGSLTRAQPKRVAAYPVPVAPLAEQTRISDQLDTLLARINACNDHLDAVPGLLKRFRQAAVSAAMAGKLTEEWPGASPVQAWDVDELQALCERHRVITYGVVKLGDETSGGTPCLRTSNVRWLKFETDGMKRISPELSAQYSRTLLNGGEVLVNVRGTLGGVAVATSAMLGWNVSREVAVVPVESKRISPQFMAYWVASAESQRWLARMEKGVAYVGINIEDLRRLPVRYPSRDEQDEIVKRLGELLLIADKIEKRLVKMTAHSNRLAPQILTKAFRGELVPQDPNDEPTIALLARLAAERGHAGAAPRTRQARSPRAALSPNVPSFSSKTMPTKSRQDEDVKGKPYLADHLRRLGQPVDAKTLYDASELPVPDFYKQLAWEIAEGHVKDASALLEPARHAA